MTAYFRRGLGGRLTMGHSLLPDHVLTQVLGHLTPSERGVARQVCRAWNDACCHPALLSQSVLTLVGSFGGLTLHSILASRQVRCLHLLETDNDSILSQLTSLDDDAGQFVVHLELENCQVTFATFLHVIRVFSGLETLRLTGVNSVFMAGQVTQSDASLVYTLRRCFKRLRSLQLAGISYLNDDNVGVLLDCAPGLGEVGLHGIKLAYHLENMTRGSILAFSTLLNHIQMRGSLLKSLSFDYTNINDLMLQDLSTLDDLQLTHLSLVACKDVKDDGLVPFLQSQPGLQSVDLSMLTEISSKVMLTLEQACRSLERLTLRKCTSITGTHIPCLASLPLAHLDLSECCRLEIGAATQLLAERGLPLLKSLYLDYCPNITSAFIIGLTEQSPKLQTLSLSTITDMNTAAMRALVGNLGRLESLKISWSTSLNDFHLLGVTDQLQRTMLIRDCRSKSLLPAGSEHCTCPFYESLQLAVDCPLNQSAFKLSRLWSLTSLDLSACPRVTDLGVCHALRLPHLTSLSLRMCAKVTDLGVRAVCASCPRVERLDLGYTNLTDDGVREIAKQLKLLRRLYLPSCSRLTNSSIGYLEAFCHHLTHLDVSLCPAISVQALGHFQRTVTTCHSIKSRFISSGTYIETAVY